MARSRGRGNATHQLISFTDVLPTLASVVEQPLPELRLLTGEASILFCG